MGRGRGVSRGGGGSQKAEGLALGFGLGGAHVCGGRGCQEGVGIVWIQEGCMGRMNGMHQMGRAGGRGTGARHIDGKAVTDTTQEGRGS